MDIAFCVRDENEKLKILFSRSSQNHIPKVDEWFDTLMSANDLFLKTETRAFIELYERARVITE